MKTDTKLKIFVVNVQYNVEEDTAVCWVCLVVVGSPVTPLSMSVEPLEFDQDDDDDD